jgi:hypothetical protein
MLRYLLTIKLLSRTFQFKSVHRILLTILVILGILSVVYTANLFLTLSERTSPHHEHTHKPS